MHENGQVDRPLGHLATSLYEKWSDPGRGTELFAFFYDMQGSKKKKKSGWLVLGLRMLSSSLGHILNIQDQLYIY